MRKILMFVVLAGFVLLTPLVSNASVTYSYQYSAPGEEYLVIEGTSSVSLSFSLATLNQGQLEWKFTNGTTSTYQDQNGNAFNYGSWYSLPSGSSGEDFKNLSGSLGLDLRLKWNGVSYDLIQGTNSSTILPPNYGLPETTALVYWLKGGFGNNTTVISANAVPIPGAVWFLASGLAGLAALRRKIAV
ncbi:MAG: VPLPA-CTERM sorting domain-containing protein [Anaerolineaceae bacterium]|nr:VPLPA-CTERM sorting domain-containing protein [Desulfobacteraceae bacterium]